MILLTGGNGLVGSYVARKLLIENEAFKILVRANSDLTLLKDVLSGIQIIEGDILDIVSLEIALEGVDQIIHCAAVVSFGEINTEQMYKINVEGTKNVVNVALANGIKRFCYLSSVAAIGRDTKKLRIDENTKWVESNMNSQYAISKYQAELEVWRGIEEGLSCIMLCPTVVIGPGDWNKSSTKLFKNIYKGMVFYPSGSINVVDVRDVADAVWLALRSNISAERYLINAQNLSYKDFFTKIAVGFGNKPPSIKLSKTIILPFFYLLKIIAPFYLKKRFINKETILISDSHFEYGNDKFINTFNFKYRSTDDAIQWVCEELLKK